MKTSKAKTISRPKKTSEAGKESKRKKVTASKSIPSEEEIRKKRMKSTTSVLPMGNMELQ